MGSGLFNKALEYSGDDEDLHFAAGIAHLRLDDLDNAEVAFATAVELDARHVPALHNLATVYERTNRQARPWCTTSEYRSWRHISTTSKLPETQSTTSSTCSSRVMKSD